MNTADSPNQNSKIKNQKYSLKRGLGFWELTFKGEHAILKHEQGLAYVSYLLTHPNEPIHGLALALKIRALRNGEPADSAQVIQERALALDDAEAARSLFRKQRALEELVEDELQSDQAKAYAYRDLEAIYAFQKKNLSRTTSVAQKASHSVGMAIKRLQQRLAKAVNADGTPNKVLRRFAAHIKQYILIPSGRGNHGGMRVQGCGGFFNYELPPTVVWR
jgi:hypothetical protein